jgi:HEAT repeat protein
LIGTLKDEDRVVCVVVANSLVELRDSRTVELLINALKDEELDMVAEVLVAIGASSVKPLIEVLNGFIV